MNREKQALTSGGAEPRMGEINGIPSLSGVWEVVRVDSEFGDI